MKKLFILSCIIIVHLTNAQNLVPNPGFESHVSCPTAQTQFLPTDWYNPAISGPGINATPDYYNTCGAGTANAPNTGFGTCAPHNGNGMIGLVVFNTLCTNYREYAEIQLSCALAVGSTYTVSFWVTKGATPTSSGNCNGYQSFTIDKLGVLFTSGNAPQPWSPTAPSGQGNYQPINASPQWETSVPVTNSSWQKYSFLITPTSNWDHMTIGCFKKDSILSVGNTNTICHSYCANYFFDDFEVLAPNSTPSISSNAGYLICSGKCTTLSANSTSSYTWSNGISNVPISVCPTVNTTYTLLGKNPSCHSFTSSVTIGLFPTPTISATSATICTGGTANLTSSGASTYTWLPGNIVGSQVNFSPTGTTIYTVTGTNANGCIASPVTATVTVLPAPPINVSPSSAICLGQCVSLSASGVLYYQWSNGTFNSTALVCPTISTTYSLTGYTNYCSSFTQTVSIAVSPPPIVSASSMTICSGSAAILNASGANTYTWQPGTIVGNGVSVSPNSTTIFNVTGTSSSGCIGSPTSVTVTVLSTPSLVINASPNVLCRNQSNTITVSGANSGYFWAPTNTYGNILVLSNLPLTPVTYTVYGFNSNGCSSTTTISLSPGAPIGMSVANSTFCTNATFNTTLTAISGATGVNFNWMPGNVNGIQAIVTPTANTIYTVTAGGAGFCSETNTLSVSVIHDCCTQPTTGLTPLSNINGSYSGSYLVSNNIILTGNSDFSNAEVLMKPGVSITIPQGMNLKLKQAHLYACGVNMWQGIVVQDGGSISAPSGSLTSLIEDANIAVDVSNISPAHASPPASLSQVIFNRNYIGLRVSNSPLSGILIDVRSCVFTSRTIPFTSSTWPSAGIGISELRYAAQTATLGVVSPYQMLGFAQANLKMPYSNQPGQIGIKIQNIGDQSGILAPAQGVDLGKSVNTNFTEFNLFDGLGTGIDVVNASMSTANNVFQDMKRYNTPSGLYGGTGIITDINTQLNAMIDLSPIVGAGTSEGNRFWNCYQGVDLSNVQDFFCEVGIFRSSQSTALTGYLPGYSGINFATNKFNCKISNCEFNNLFKGVEVNINPGNYIFNNTVYSGVLAQNLIITENYFGADVNSNSILPLNTLAPPPPMQYFGDAIKIAGSNGSFWNIQGTCSLTSNKINRAFRGIFVDGMNDFPIDVSGNLISLFDDWTYNQPQYGIEVSNNQDFLSITQNTVSAQFSSSSSQYMPPNSPPFLNSNVSLIHLIDNVSLSNSPSPIVKCNYLFDGYMGFEFDGQQVNTDWTANTMNQPMSFGLSLFMNGAIGMQGTSNMGAGNKWTGVWSGSSSETQCDPSSNPISSFLWCSILPNSVPINNFPGVNMYIQPASYDLVKTGIEFDCSGQASYANTPSQRLMATSVKESNGESISGLQLSPNPVNSEFKITGVLKDAKIQISIFDLNGTLILTEKVAANQSVDVSQLNAGVYFARIDRGDGKFVFKKFLKI